MKKIKDLFISVLVFLDMVFCSVFMLSWWGDSLADFINYIKTTNVVVGKDITIYIGLIFIMGPVLIVMTFFIGLFIIIGIDKGLDKLIWNNDRENV